jgi:hypothetical protein
VVAPLGSTLAELSVEPFFREFRYQAGTTELPLFDEQPPQGSPRDPRHPATQEPPLPEVWWRGLPRRTGSPWPTSPAT